MNQSEQVEQNILDVGTSRMNRLYDRFFKRLFIENKSVLIDFINDTLLFEGLDAIADLEILPGELIQAHAGMKLAVLDVSARLSDGRTVDIEVQLVNRRDFRKRTPFYWAMRHVTKLGAGMTYLEIRPTICICLLAFDLFGEEPGYRNVYGIRNESSGNALCEDMQIVYLELPKFRRQLDREQVPQTGLERWLLYFSNEEGDLMERTVEQDSAISRARTLEHSFWLDKRERERYFAVQKRLMDEISRERNHEVLLQQERERALAEGLAEGQERGKRESQLEIAHRMLCSGITPDVVAKISGLPEEEVHDLLP